MKEKFDEIRGNNQGTPINKNGQDIDLMDEACSAARVGSEARAGSEAERGMGAERGSEVERGLEFEAGSEVDADSGVESSSSAELRAMQAKALMQSGQIYSTVDPVLVEEQAKARALMVEVHRRYLAGEDVTGMFGEVFAEYGENSYIELPFFANWGKHTHIGKEVYVNFNLTLVDDAPVTIGDYCMIGPNVTISTAEHPLDAEARRVKHQFNKPVVLEDNVWLGAGVVVLAGVTIGENSVIGAGSVVTKDIPANVVAVGVPCRVVREIG